MNVSLETLPCNLSKNAMPCVFRIIYTKAVGGLFSLKISKYRLH